jgi:hypothetical protein
VGGVAFSKPASLPFWCARNSAKAAKRQRSGATFMLPLSETDFLILDLGLTIDFERGPDKAVSGMRLSGVIWDGRAQRRR